MEKTTNIVALMVNDHCKIEQLLINFEKNIEREKSEMKKAFYDFEWELEKHIFIEERAIYTQYEPEDIAGGYKMLPKITAQHNYIINKLQNLRRDIHKNRSLSDIDDFKNFINDHKNFEEKDVYPLLDQTLGKEQKKQIYEKINEIIKTIKK
jgi:hemerythrin-like domain-containing protein